MSLSPELMEDFNQIKQELQKKYERAKAYSGLYRIMPEVARGNSFIVDALEPVVEVISKLDLNGNDSTEGLREFSKRWQDAVKELPDIRRNLERFDGVYDDIWDNMSQVDKGINEFLENFDLQETPDIEKETKTNEEKQKKFESVDLQRNMQKADVTKTQSDAEKVLEEQKIAIKEKSGNGNEVQEKAIREQIDENKKSDIKPKKLNVIDELKRIDKMVDRSHSGESFKNMMFALKELSEQNVLPKEMVDTYRYMFNEVKKHGNTQRGVLDLSTEINNQIEELKNDRFASGIQNIKKLGVEKSIILKHKIDLQNS